jgi:hypothetical protein
MPVAVTYEGLELQWIIVGPPGPNLGRRTTHWCMCKCGGSEQFLVTRLDIRQALRRKGNPRCAKCMRQRPAQSDLVGRVIGKVKITGRENNAVLPGGRTELVYSARCLCPAATKMTVRYSKIKKALQRNVALHCGCLDLNLAGQKFGSWLVLGSAECPASKQQDDQRWWLVECQGCPSRTRKVVSTSNLRSKRGTKDCGCQAGARSAWIWAQKRESIVVLGVRKLRRGIVNKARERGLEFELTDEQCADLLFAPCSYCGSLRRQHTNVETYVGTWGGREKNERKELGAIFHGGIDRIDPYEHYYPENVCPACKFCNWFKQDMTVEEFRTWVKRVGERAAGLVDKANRTFKSLFSVAAAYREPVAPHSSAMIDSIPSAVRRHIERALYTALKQRYKGREYAIGIDKAVFLDLLYRNCTYCGEPARNEYNAWRKSGPVAYRGAAFEYKYTGLDRVDPTMGYTTSNVTPCCSRCNIAKRDLTVEEFFKRVFLIARFWGPSFAMPKTLLPAKTTSRVHSQPGGQVVCAP